MAFTTPELLSVVGVLAVLLGAIVYNNVAAARATRRASRATAEATWVGRHLHFEGDVLGEVVAEDAERVVVRKGAETLAVPRSQVRPRGHDLGLKPPFDRAAAVEAGGKWQP